MHTHKIYPQKILDFRFTILNFTNKLSINSLPSLLGSDQTLLWESPHKCYGNEVEHFVTIYNSAHLVKSGTAPLSEVSLSIVVIHVEC